MKIVICASEAVPFAKTGGLADVAGALPLVLEKEGQNVIVVMPAYKPLKNLKGLRIERPKGNISYAVIGENLKVYFVENDKYFNRDGLYQDKKGDYADNLDRFSYYCRRTLELLKEIDFKPDIIHCHDWQAAMIPVYLKSAYQGDRFFSNTRTVFTIHNIGYQGLFPREEFPKLGLDWKFFNPDMLEFYGKVNILKGGIIFSDIITTVSPTYSREIQTKEFGFGLEGVLNKRRDSLSGILNGLDYSIWDPSSDKFIVKNYSLNNLRDKCANKEELQRICNLPIKEDVPLFGIVSRLAQQKGLDILTEAIDGICKMNLQLVILGTGDVKYHLLLEEIVKKYPKVVSLHLKFDDPLAHKIYAGSDIFLMPSRYEPCGLGQMISLRYATIPLVFKTGGLADTVNENNGFVFDVYGKEGLLKTIKRAMVIFKNDEKWGKLLRQAMECNFSWEESAKQYVQLYGRAIP